MSEPSFRLVRTPVLVGRTGELHALLDAVGHPPSVALVEGEPGIGKSRLIGEALRHLSAQGRRVLQGSCHPLREPFPYGPVFDLLRRLGSDVPTGLDPVCGALRPYLPEIADRLPPQPEDLHDLRSARHRLFRGVRALLAAMGTAVMVVEDLHWADDGTRDLLRFLIDDPPRHLSVLLSYRREDLPGSGLPLGHAYRHRPGTTSVVVPLDPLDVASVRSMFAAMSGTTEVSAAFAAELHRRTAGIPFVVEEVVRALPGHVRGARQDAEGGALDMIAVPALLQDAIAERMDGLSPAAVHAVRAASVLRVPAGEALLAAVMEGGAGTVQAHGSGADVASAVREALLAGVLHEAGPDRYGFRHALAQQAVYASVCGPDKRAMHRQAMRALADEVPPPLVQLTYHAQQAGDTSAWLHYAEATAAHAREIGDLPLAVQVREELLSQGRLGGTERARIAVGLSRDAVLGLTHRRVCRLLRGIVRDSDIPDGLRGEIRLNLALLLNNQAGRYAQGRADTEIAVDELRDRPALAARGMAALAMPGWGEQPLHVHEHWIEQAESLTADRNSRAGRPDRPDQPGRPDRPNRPSRPDRSVRTAVRGNHLALRMSCGDPDVWEQAELLVREAGPDNRHQVARACGNFADAATYLGHYAAAQHFSEEGRRQAAACGAPFFESIVEGTSLRLDWYAGRWRGLADRATSALDVVHHVSGVAADAHLVLGLLASALGEWDEAVAALGAAGLDDPENAPAPILAGASAALARLRLARGETHAARAVSADGLARVRSKGIWPWAGDLAPVAVMAHHRCGDSVEAERITAQLTDGIAGRDAPLAEAALAACRGLNASARGHTADAVAAFEAAHAAYAELGQPYSAARARESAARSRLAGGDSADSTATAQLTALVGDFTALGAIRDAARCRHVLRRSGVALPSRRGRRGYGDRLSPRESEVARLVALGRTNREIADVLFLSPRTVEQHVAKVLRKLDVSSRADVTT